MDGDSARAAVAYPTSEDDTYAEIGRQFGVFLRRADRFYQGIGLETDGRGLERAAYMLLGRIATRGPLRLSALACEMSLDLSTVSRQVAALESAGLVARTPDATDRRASLIQATPTGVDVFTRNRAKSLAALRTLLADWTPEERAEFARLFGRLNEAFLAMSAGGAAGGTDVSAGGAAGGTKQETS